MHIITLPHAALAPSHAPAGFLGSLAFAAGIALGAYAWRPSLWWTAAAAAFLGAAAYFLRPRFAAAVTLALSAFLCVGALCFQLHAASGAPNGLPAFKLNYGKTAALLEGDAEKRIKQRLATNGNARAELLKVGHHGSATSSTAEFLSAVHPDYAVISVGAHNPFGYPRQKVLARLEASRVATFRTDVHGVVSSYLDGRGVEARLPGR